MNCKVVEELLPAYSLSALSPEEEALVEAHLDTCPWCPVQLREHMLVAALLSHAAEPAELSARLKERVIRTVPSKKAERNQRVQRSIFAPARLLLGATASITVMLVAAVVAVSLLMTNEIDDLKKDNSELTSEVTRLTSVGSQMSDKMEVLQGENSSLNSQVTLLSLQDEKLTEMLMEQRSMNYIMAAPDKKLLALYGDESLTDAQGVLLIAGPDGSGILMTKGLEPSPENMAYQVWLRKDGEPARAGELSVDEEGWGVLSLWPDQPITLFQQVWVTQEPIKTATKPSGKPILWGRIAP